MKSSIAQQLWDTDKEIDIAKDQEKKEGLFLRKRSDSRLDKNIDAVFDKLIVFYERTIIDKARVVFGSNLIEVRYSNNPFCPKAYYLDDFLTLPEENQFDFDICSGINIEDIEQSLLAMKSLRFKDVEYLEAFRINSFSGNIWAYFSSSSSLITDYRYFLDFQKIRSDPQVSHDAALARMKLSSSFFRGDFFRGDKEFFDNRLKARRKESETDQRIDQMIATVLKLFRENKIFEIQVYLGSGVIRVITPEEPYTTYAFNGVEELKLAEEHYKNTPMNLEQSLKNKNLNRPNLRMNRNLVNKAFMAAKKYRLIDESLYLRVFYIDFIYNHILTSFSCGGTRYQSSEKFIEDYYRFFDTNK